MGFGLTGGSKTRVPRSDYSFHFESHNREGGHAVRKIGGDKCATDWEVRMKN